MTDATLDAIASGLGARSANAEWMQGTGDEVVVRGDDGGVYMLKPESEFNQSENDALIAYLDATNPEAKIGILPEGIFIAAVLARIDPHSAGLEATVQGLAVTLTESVRFIDDPRANFESLKKYYGLGNDEEIKSLISKFMITELAGDISENDGEEVGLRTRIVEEVREGKYKTALFLYWLSGGDDMFAMDDEKRKLVMGYFGSKACNDLDNHPSVKLLLDKPPEGMTEEDYPVLVNLLKVR